MYVSLPLSAGPKPQPPTRARARTRASPRGRGADARARAPPQPVPRAGGGASQAGGSAAGAGEAEDLAAEVSPAPARPAKTPSQYGFDELTQTTTVHFGAREWFHPAIEGVEPIPHKRSNLTAVESKPKGDLSILHFNDVYEIGENKQEPCGGAPRFAQCLKSHRYLNPVTTFGGDALNPSILSQVTEGKHMIDVLNEMDIACAVIGNHDLDLGLENFVRQIQGCDFPWLCSNCWHSETGEPLGNCHEAAVILHGGYKIGVIGLIEDDWLSCCTTIDPDTLDYTDFVEVARKLAVKLREEEACDLVLALTHFREPNDERLAREAPEIDLVLGGHDHHYAVKEVKETGVWYVKSGCDFRHLSRVTLSPVPGKGRMNTSVTKIDITRDITEEPIVASICKQYNDKMKAAMSRQIGEIDAPLDARFAMVRTQETNCGNWCADVARLGCHADICILNSGTLRADVVYPPGEFTVEDLIKLLPFANLLYVMGVKGDKLLPLLENGVSKWPAKDGRFPQVSNMAFTFDGNKPSGERVVADSITVGGEPVDPEREYSCVCLDFAAKGMEGYDAFLEGRVIMDGETTIPLATLVRNHLTCVSVINKTTSLLQRKDTAGYAVSKFKKLSSSHSLRLAETATNETGIKIHPKIEGRIVNLAAPTPSEP